MDERSLDGLLSPRSVALVGASRSPGKVGHDILRNLVEGGYRGVVVPVNREADSLLGLPVCRAIGDYGGPVDLALIAVPAGGVMDALRETLRAGVKAVAVITAGFRETGEEGARIEREMAGLCRSHDVRLLGPNCLGLINTALPLNASFASVMPRAGGISIFSQSGALCTAMIDAAVERRVGLGKVVSIGNKADLTEVDFLAALARDEQTKVIVAYLEDIRSGDDFIAAAEEASTVKPVIIMKSGTTEAGARAASSHTGVLAGAEIAYGAAFLRAGVVRADHFEDLFDYATAFAMQPLPEGKRVLIITNAGGPGIMAADAVERAGLEVARLDRSTAASLRQKLPPAAGTGNPVDVLGDADPGRYEAALAAAQDDGHVDAILVVLTPQAMTKPAETARAVAGCLKGDKPVLAVFMGGAEVMPGRQELAAAGLPDYGAPERAVQALKAMYDYAFWRKRPRRIVTRFRVNRRRVERIITRSMKIGRMRVSEVRSKSILRAYGFRTPEGYLATTSTEAMEAADRIGYPVAMKIVSPDIIHKSDLGGVRLNLIDRKAVEDAFDLIMIRTAERAPRASIDGVYIEKMLARGVEVIIGMSRDPQFGPMLMFGLGGIFVEVMKDVAFHLAPVTHDEALQMLTATRSYRMLTGARGQRGVDMGAIAVGIQRISQLATDFPQVAELDINPFMVGETGEEPFVADARITLRSPEGEES